MAGRRRRFGLPDARVRGCVRVPRHARAGAGGAAGKLGREFLPCRLTAPRTNRISELMRTLTPTTEAGPSPRQDRFEGLSRCRPRAARVARLARGRGGFTLIEAALVMTIISVGVMAMLELLATGTVSNAEGAETTVAYNLAKNVREMTFGMAIADPTSPTNWGVESGETLATYDDIDDLDGQSFSPPIDGRRQPLNDLTGWRQTVTVRSVDPDRMTLAVPNGSTPALRVTVTVSHHGKDVATLSWLAFDASN